MRAVPDKPNLGSLGERLNANTIAIVSGGLNDTYLKIADDLAAVLDHGDDFRVLPVIGKGGGQNIRDVRFLKGVDLGITQPVLLNALRASNEIGSIDDQIVYIAKLFNEEMHVVVRADAAIGSIAQLAGMKVNLGGTGSSGGPLATRDVFRRLGVKVQELDMGEADALEQLKSGAIAATVLMAGKPVPALARLKAADGFRLLPVPFAKELQDHYLPAELDAADYPNLIAPGPGVATVAAGAVLIAYNWPPGSDRYRRIAKFVDLFFSRVAELQKPPRHPKWRETNLAATVPGWRRFPAAEQWLQQNRQTPPASLDTRAQFDRFLAARHASGAGDVPVSAEERERLFQEFLRWQAHGH